MIAPNRRCRPGGNSRARTRVANFAARVLGAEALVGDDLPDAVAYQPAYTIQGGMSPIMRNILGERVLGLPREPKGT